MCLGKTNFLCAQEDNLQYDIHNQCLLIIKIFRTDELNKYPQVPRRKKNFMLHGCFKIELKV